MITHKIAADEFNDPKCSFADYSLCFRIKQNNRKISKRFMNVLCSKVKLVILSQFSGQYKDFYPRMKAALKEQVRVSPFTHKQH